MGAKPNTDHNNERDVTQNPPQWTKKCWLTGKSGKVQHFVQATVQQATEQTNFPTTNNQLLSDHNSQPPQPTPAQQQ